jgi:hypothetical protein
MNAIEPREEPCEPCLDCPERRFRRMLIRGHSAIGHSVRLVASAGRKGTEKALCFRQLQLSAYRL